MSTSSIPVNPFISVVMPVYNAERYVADAINSILTQTHSNFEFIIVDDGSTDNSAGIVREFAARDARIRPLFPEHSGRSRASNLAIAEAQSEWIARIDADDIALPQRLAVQIDWIRRTGVDICGSSVKRFGTETGLLWFPEDHQAICYELLFRIGLLNPTVMIRTEIARAHPYDDQTAHEDYEMWTRLAPLYRMSNVPQVLLMHRCHPHQSHVLESPAFKADILKFSQRLFVTLFPDATAADYAALADVVARQPSPSLNSLERAGQWLVRFAQHPDNFLRQRMAERWRTSCLQSTHLGLGVYDLYRRIVREIGTPSNPDARKLWLACALQVRYGSLFHSGISRLGGLMHLPNRDS